MTKIAITGTGRCGTTFLVRIFTFVGLDTGFSPNQLIQASVYLGYSSGPLQARENYEEILDADVSIEPCGNADPLNGNIGLETNLSTDTYTQQVIKSPFFMQQAVALVKSHGVKVFIVPLRDFKEVVDSREARQGYKGGPWLLGVQDYENLVGGFDNTIQQLKKDNYDVSVIYLNFYKMIESKLYLYNKLENVLKKYGVKKDIFFQAYDAATSLWEPGFF